MTFIERGLPNFLRFLIHCRARVDLLRSTVWENLTYEWLNFKSVECMLISLFICQVARKRGRMKIKEEPEVVLEPEAPPPLDDPGEPPGQEVLKQFKLIYFNKIICF